MSFSDPNRTADPAPPSDFTPVSRNADRPNVMCDDPITGSAPTYGNEGTYLDTLPTIPGYAIEGEIARGGMGVVYRARHLQLNRPAAIKMILGGRYQSQAAQLRFSIEAEAIAALDHPYVVHVDEFGTHEGLPYFALEYVGGGTLARRLARDGKLNPREAAELVVKLADGIASAHAKGIVHRDLKPGNILLTEAGEPKITDFGLAKVGQSDLTTTGAVMGTPSYMSPEQAAGRTKEVGTHSDVYALGAILYELMTGRPPFKGDSATDTIQQVLTQEPQRPRALIPLIPRDLETICLKCLAKEPSKRFATAADLKADLTAYLTGYPITARPVSIAERVWKWVQRENSASFTRFLTTTTLISVLIAIVVVATAMAIQEYRDLERAEILETDLLNANPERVSVVVAQLRDEDESVREYAHGLLTKRANDEPVTNSLGLHARLGLLTYDEPDRALEVAAYLPKSRPEHLHAIRLFLIPYRKVVAPELWAVVMNQRALPRERVQAAGALTYLDVVDARWTEVAPFIAETVVTASPRDFVVWSQALEGAGWALKPVLLDRYALARRRIESRKLTTSALVAESAAFELTAYWLAMYVEKYPDSNSLNKLAKTMDVTDRHYRLFADVFARELKPPVEPSKSSK